MSHAETHARLHDCFNSRDFAAIEDSCAPGFLFEDLARALTVKTPADFTEYLRGWVTTMSDAAVGSPTYLDGPDFSVATFHGRGHFDGTLGDVSGSGRMLDLPMCEVLHYAADGSVLSGELYYDQVAMLSQLGVMSAEAAAPALESPTAFVRAMLRDFDRLDITAMRARLADDAQGVDEISRAWIRGAEGIDAYFRGLEGAVADVATTLYDLNEQVTGETALVTGWMEQDYTMQGSPVHISAPFTAGLRRDGDSWKATLMHAVPLTEEEK